MGAGGSSTLKAHQPSIWQQPISCEILTDFSQGTANEHLGMEFVSVGDDFITTCPVHIGRTTQVWQIELKHDAGELTCVSRITMAVLAQR